MTKEKEMMSKDDELKKLILDKYRSLINSVQALEDISSNLSDLHSIRVQLGNNLSGLNFEEIEAKLQQVKFDEQFVEDDENVNVYSFNDNYSKCLKWFKAKEYLELLNTTKAMKSYIVSNRHDYTKVNDNKESYDYLIVDLCESIMNDFISDDKWLSNIDNYKQLFDVIDNELLIDDESKQRLELSEFYWKINYDDSINNLINTYFTNSTDTFSISLLIRLLLLKLSESLALLSQSKDEGFICDNNAKYITDIYNLIIGIMCIYKTYILVSSDNDNNAFTMLKEFYTFLRNEIMTTISSLLVLSKDNIIWYKELTTGKLLVFWDSILSSITNTINSNESIIRDLEQILTKDCISFFLLDKAIDQIGNVTNQQMSLFYIDNYTNITVNNLTKIKDKTDNKIYQILQAVDTLNSLPELKTKSLACITTCLDKLLTKAIDIFTGNYSQSAIITYINFIMKLFSYSEVTTLLNKLSMTNIMSKVNEISSWYIQSNFSQIEHYISSTFKEYLSYENYSIEESNYNTLTCTESLKELLWYLHSFDIKQSEYKIKIYNLIYKVYETIVNNANDTVFNPNILIDINCLLYIKFNDNDSNDIIVEDYSNIIKWIEDKYHLKNKYVNDNTDAIGKVELEKLFKENYYEDDIKFPLRKNFSFKSANAKKDLIPIVNNNKLNVYLIYPTKLNQNDKSNISTNTVNTNSTCKLLEHRIDENYLSLRPSKPNIAIQNNTNNKNNKVPVQTNPNSKPFSQFTANNLLSGKFFNLNG